MTGGTEAPIGPYALTCQITNDLLSRSADPQRAYLPFDAAACGYVPGEGGAILIAEREDSALARGVDKPYGEIAGYASSFDPRPGTGRQPTLQRAAEAALADARIAPQDVDVVFADGAGLPGLDRTEAAALAALFGPFGVPVTVPKTLCGPAVRGRTAARRGRRVAGHARRA